MCTFGVLGLSCASPGGPGAFFKRDFSESGRTTPPDAAPDDDARSPFAGIGGLGQETR